MEGSINIRFYRHGSTVSNERRLYLGRSDEPLSENGKRHLTAAARTPELLFVSPMKRCVETARILFPGQPFRGIDDWREMDFGAWEGKGYDVLKDDPAYLAWLDSGCALPVPGGESREAFCLRCRRGLLTALRRRGGAKDIAAVVHGGTIMAVMSAVTGEDFFDFLTENGQGYELRMSEEAVTELLSVRPKEGAKFCEISKAEWGKIQSL